MKKYLSSTSNETRIVQFSFLVYIIISYAYMILKVEISSLTLIKGVILVFIYVILPIIFLLGVLFYTLNNWTYIIKDELLIIHNDLRKDVKIQILDIVNIEIFENEIDKSKGHKIYGKSVSRSKLEIKYSKSEKLY